MSNTTDQYTERKKYLYRVINKINGDDYVGISFNYKERWKQHISAAKRGKEGLFMDALREFGADSFEWKVIAIARNGYIGGHLERIARRCGYGTYNATMGGEGWAEPTQATKEKLAAANRGRKHTPQAIANMTAAQRALNKTLSDEHRKLISAVHLGKTDSAETRRKKSEAKKGKKFTPEHAAKIGQANLGRKHTEEDLRNMSKPRSEEGKAVIAEAQRARRERERQEKIAKGILPKVKTKTVSEETRQRQCIAAQARVARQRAEKAALALVNQK